MNCIRIGVWSNYIINIIVVIFAVYILFINVFAIDSVIDSLKYHNTLKFFPLFNLPFYYYLFVF